MSDRASSGNEPFFSWPSPDEAAREVWYSLVSHPNEPVAFWHRYTLLETEDGRGEARLWAALTDETADRSVFETRTVDRGRIGLAREPFELALDEESHLRDDGSSGRLETAAGPMRWQFEYEPDPTTFTPIRDEALMRDAASRLGTGCHWSANQSVRMSGTVTVGGETYAFRDAPGHQGHTAGSSAPDEVVWGHCNSFSAGVAVEVLHVDGLFTPVLVRRPESTLRLNEQARLFGDSPVEILDDDPASGVLELAGEVEDSSFAVRFEADGPTHRASYLLPDDEIRYNAHCSLATVDLTVDGETYSAEGGRVEWVRSTPPRDGSYPPFAADG